MVSPKSRQYLLFAGLLCLLLATVPWAYTRIHQDIVLFHKAQQSFMANDYEKAAKRYRMALAKGMDNPRLLERLGDTHLVLEEFDKALDAFMKLGQQKPEDLALQLKLAHMYSLNNQTDKALAVIDRVLEKKPGWETALLWQARILARQGRFREAIDIYYRILGEEP